MRFTHKSMLRVAVLIGTLAVSPAVCVAQPAPGRSVAEEEVRKLNAVEVQAFLDNDVKKLAELWSHEFVVTNPLNQFVTGKQVLAMVQEGTLAMTSFTRQIDYVRTYGDIVIVAGSEDVVWSGKMPLAGKASHLRFTAVWARRDGAWKEVARHANIVK